MTRHHTQSPRPSSEDARLRMERQARRNTAPEVALRSNLHRRGLRFRIHVRPSPASRREADIVFSSAKVAVFVDGCFWHGCPDHVTWPKKNAEWWRAKIEANQARDRDTDSKLCAQGWLSIRVWEHEDPALAAERVARIIQARIIGPDSQG
jgi:DNA mismatch endonuclease (patch repair protein)